MSEPVSIASLSRREVDCLSLVSLGLQSKEIGPILGIAPGTVDVTLKRAGKKVGTSDRRRLAALLREHSPDLYQSTIQRLDMARKSFEIDHLARADASTGQSLNSDTASQPGWLPLPSKGRTWNDLTTWQRRAWVIVIAIGATLLGLVMVTLSRHTLVNAPRTFEVGYRRI